MLGFGCSASALLWNGSPSGQRHPNKADLAALLIFLQDNNRAGSLVGLRGGHGALKPQRGRRGAGLLLSLSVAALGLLFVLGCADPVQTPPMHLQHACQVDCFFFIILATCLSTRRHLLRGVSGFPGRASAAAAAVAPNLELQQRLISILPAGKPSAIKPLTMTVVLAGHTVLVHVHRTFSGMRCGVVQASRFSRSCADRRPVPPLARFRGGLFARRPLRTRRQGAVIPRRASPEMVSRRLHPRQRFPCRAKRHACPSADLFRGRPFRNEDEPRDRLHRRDPRARRHDVRGGVLGAGAALLLQPPPPTTSPY